MPVNKRIRVRYNGGPQARLEYDGSNYTDLTVSSTGSLIIDPVDEFVVTVAGSDHLRLREGGVVGNGRQTLFVRDFDAWSTAHGGASIDDMNNFHFWDTGVLHVEFESDDNDMRFYLEGGPGKQAWYGVQESATHHWSHGIGTDFDTADSYRFCTGFGLTAGTTQFLVRKSGQVAPLTMSSTVPAYAFQDAAYNSGLGSPSAGIVSIITSGTEAVRWTAANQTLNPLGSAAAPPRSFIGDQDTGEFSPAANNWAVATAGVEAFRANAAQQLCLKSSGGTAAFPALAWQGSLTTGLFLPSANNLGLAANGAEVLRLTASGRIRTFSLPTSAAGLSAGEIWNDSGTLKVA